MGLVRVERGQLVLVAAAVVAIALVPVLFAYLQLGYHPDVGGTEPAVTGEEAVAYLDRSVHDATAATAGDYAWDDRERRAEAVREAVDGDVDTLEASRLEEGVAYDVSYNATAATEWAAGNCPRGPGRRFGECDVDGAVVLQERAGEAVSLAVAFDVRVVAPDGSADLTLVVEVGG